jgi:hypothetical protein
MNQPVIQTKSYSTERLSRNEKEANNFLWYREKIDMYDTKSNFSSVGYGGVNEYKRMRVNYDLFNNIVDLSDFAYVASPYGAEQGEMPAQMVNRDICSYRVKALIGMEMKRPFGYRIIATNKEASNRKVEEETNIESEKKDDNTNKDRIHNCSSIDTQYSSGYRQRLKNYHGFPL